MSKKFRSIILTFASVLTMVLPSLAPVAVYAQTPAQTQINQGLCSGTSLTTSGATCSGTQSSTKINSLLTTIINIFSLIVGVVAVLMIIVGGLRYITSGGESSNVSSAKNTIIYAIVGLVIVALSQFIVHFVLGKVSGTI